MRVRVKVSNTTGGRYRVHPRDSVDVVVTSDSPPDLQWEHADGEDSLFAVLDPAGAHAEVFRGDEKLIAF